MAAAEIALVARAKGLSSHLFARDTLESLAEAGDLAAFVRGLAHPGATLDPVGEPADVFAIERAVARTANRYLQTLQRWQERTGGVLDVFVADQDRRSLRALLRGAAQGAPSEARLDGLLPTPSLPRLALLELARQASPADVTRQLVLLAHPDAPRLRPLVQKAQPDLLALDVALLLGFADRATQSAARGDLTLREYVAELIDVGNAQNAFLNAGRARDIDAARFVRGGRWLPESAFASVAAAASQHEGFTRLRTALAGSPLASLLPMGTKDVSHLDRAFLAGTLQRLAFRARLEPLSTAPLLRLLLRIEAQSRDLRALAWGAALGTPVPLRKQQLITPP